MDADQADAVYLITLNGLFVDGVIPATQEGINVAAGVLQELAHLVIEGTDVGTFVL